MRQLFERPLLEAETGERERSLAGAAALAADVLTGAPTTAVSASAAGPSASDPGYAWNHGLYWLASNVSTDSPLAPVVDDLQWCDAPSARAPAFMARRLEGQALALILRAAIDEDLSAAERERLHCAASKIASREC